MTNPKTRNFSNRTGFLSAGIDGVEMKRTTVQALAAAEVTAAWRRIPFRMSSRTASTSSQFRIGEDALLLPEGVASRGFEDLTPGSRSHAARLPVSSSSGRGRDSGSKYRRFHVRSAQRPML